MMILPPGEDPIIKFDLIVDNDGLIEDGLCELTPGTVDETASQQSLHTGWITRIFGGSIGYFLNDPVVNIVTQFGDVCLASYGIAHLIDRAGRVVCTDDEKEVETKF